MIIGRKNYPNSTERPLTLEDYSQKFRGRQIETIVDNIDKFDTDLEKLNNNICFLETCKAEATLKPYRIDNISHNILTFHLGNNEVNSSCQKFVKNITIKGLKSYNYIDIIIGGMRIYRMYDFMYDVIVTRYNYKNKTDKSCVTIPLDILPLLIYHNLDLLIYTTDLGTKDVQVEYNVFVYDMVKDPLNIVKITKFEKNDNPTSRRDPYVIMKSFDKPLTIDEYMKSNRLLDYYGDDEIDKMYNKYITNFEKDLEKRNVFYQDNLWRTISWECVYEQIQYYGHIDPFQKQAKYRLNFNHPVNCIVMNIPSDVCIEISFNNLDKVKLKATYTVNNFTVYEIPYINFSVIDRADIFINDTFIMNSCFKLIAYAFNAQLLRVHSGMLGMIYSD